MKRPVRLSILILVAVFLILQFFQPERNLGEIDTGTDLVSFTGMPDSLASILRISCYDCHSDRTVYPWYSYIAPVSWYLESHIKKGKEQINFGEFGSFKKSRKIGALGNICEVMEEGSMPLKSYLVIHRKARIGDEELEAICTWSEAEALKVMRE